MGRVMAAVVLWETTATERIFQLCRNYSRYIIIDIVCAVVEGSKDTVEKTKCEQKKQCIVGSK